jgi:putative ABC transport system ATP-binding protein
MTPVSTSGNDLVRAVMRPRRADIVVGALLAVAHQVCEALVAIVIGIVVDRAISTGQLSQLLLWIGVLVAVFAVLASSALVGYYRLRRAGETIAHDLRVRIGTRVVDARGGTDRVARPGAVLSLATSDAGRVGEVADVVGGGLSAVVVLAGAAAYLLSTSWRLGAVVLLGLPVLVWLSQRLATPLEERSSSEQSAVAHATGVATDLLAGLRVLKGLGAEAAGSARYRAVSRAARDGRIHAARYVGLAQGVTLGLSGVFVVVVAWVGGRLAMAGTISIGELVAAVGLAGFLAEPLQRLGGLPAELAVIRASARRLAEFLDAEPGVADGHREPSGPGGLVLRAVTGGTLRGLDLTIESGAWVGVVAPDRRDATSLLDLLARRTDPDSGSIRYGDVPLPQLRLDDLRAAVLVGDHDAVLFDGTVADNVAAGNAAVDLAAVAAVAAADEVITALPAGAASPVGERGRWLSGGQRQRVALARAVAVDPEVLVLNDPTTAVDAATEHRVATRLRAARAGRSTVLVCTSPALLAACDRVVVIRDGAVTATGTHAELAAGDPSYRAAVLE